MKRILIVLVASLGMTLSSLAQAAPITYTFHPYDNSGQRMDIDDLDHYKYYV